MQSQESTIAAFALFSKHSGDIMPPCNLAIKQEEASSVIARGFLSTVVRDQPHRE